MRVVVQNTLTNRQWVAVDGPAGFLIGRDPTCDVRLESRFIAGVHARVERNDGAWEIELLPGVNPVEIDGQEYAAGQKVVVRGTARLRLMEFVLALDAAEASPEAQQQESASDRLTEVQNALHAELLRRLDLRLGSFSSNGAAGERTEKLNSVLDDLLSGEFKSRVFESDLPPIILARALRARMLDWVFTHLGREQRTTTGWAAVGISSELERSATDAIKRLSAKVGIVENKTSAVTAEQMVEARFDGVVGPVAAELLDNARTYIITSYLKKVLYDVVFGLGPLEDLLRSQSITEIMVVSPTRIYVERNGRITKAPQTFPSEAACVTIIERIVAPLGRRIDRSQPLVDARLRDGSRVNAIIEPLAVKGPCVTIRKFPVSHVSADDLVRWRSLQPFTVTLLRACVLHRCNILVSGGTSSGKTTLLNVLSGFIPGADRLITVEDSAELRLQQEHVVTLETKPANAEGTGEYTIRDLVKNALRMRPDRIIVGEVRGNEAIDMLQGMNTGHRGSMTTLHANSAADALSRLETMVLMGADIPLAAVRRQIASAIHLIIHTERMPDGRRLVCQLTEVTGLHPVTGELETRDILKVAHVGNTLELRPTGYMPTFLGEMVDQGHLQLRPWFDQVKV
ncbi:ATPase, T2SS/T4P/T4SS family [Humisphaera borealis]|uniref:Flp pilus assembly complex ATPase component TadA n=1 Tax=Humisphaera borealis TaxID=2807512 RepID=A0A7M2WS50_9BACT|nr:ATPase, T2SS/T4P/T4SS family [Humisphaera borealis]QOV88002.1 Flp pilus assembly complex ATPase component TadA [Humisphaera borealis]